MNRRIHLAVREAVHRATLLRGSRMLTACAALSLGNIALAQDATPADDPEALEEVIVIGTPGGTGTERQAVSFALTTVSPEEITKYSPSSTADLLKEIPGVWVESSGGVAGANIDVRGLPGGGDAPFVTMAINGSPIYGTEMLSFFEQSSIFRIDETIGSVEGIRGGPNAIFGKGEPGLTVNFNLMEGGEETDALVKYTTSDYDLQRLDARLSGSLGDDFYYMIGGYVSSSPGIRDPQFTAEQGKQFTLNLTKRFENGKVNVFSRITDDHGQWVLPMSLNSGNDLGTFAQLGNATRLRQLTVNTNGDTEVFDFADGRGWKGSVSGGSFEFDVGGGFSVRDQFTYTKGMANTHGFVPAGTAVTAGAVSTIKGTPVVRQDGTTLAPTDYVQTYGHWVVEKDLTSFINDLSVSKELGSHRLTAGYYRASWSSDDFWLLGNPLAVENTSNGLPLCQGSSDPASCAGQPLTTPANIAAAGGNPGFSFGLQSGGDARSQALYLADSWQATDKLRLDAGIRREKLEIDYALDTGPGFADGTNDLLSSIEGTETAYTAAVNYDFTKGFGVFARYTDGFLFPHFDDIRGGSTSVDGVKQVDLGLKYTSDHLKVYATVCGTRNDAFSSVVGGSVPATAFTTESKGVELEGVWQLGGLDLSFNGTWQDTEITRSTAASDVGNQVLRQPDFQVRVSPSYSVERGSLKATFYAAAAFIGDRFGDNANTVTLDSYEKFDAGVLLNFEQGLFIQLHGDNLSDEEGITEGDPRNPDAANSRAIFGRSIKFSLGYDF